MLVRQRYMEESPLWAANRGDPSRAAEILVRSYWVDAVGFALPVIITNLLAKGTLTSIVGSLVFDAVFGITGGAVGVWLVFPVLSKHLGTGVFFVVALAPALGLLALLLIRWEPIGTDVDADDHAPAGSDTITQPPDSPST